jgi:SAM-dependent methyltransferase
MPSDAPQRQLVRADAALLDLLRCLRRVGYQFVTPTPATHGRLRERRAREQARSLRDVFGWSMPFAPGLLPDAMADCLAQSGMLAEEEGLLLSNVRVSGLHDDLYLHSAYPTEAEDSVFFGPDSYRFADLVAAELARMPPGPEARIADVGTGAGIGAIIAAKACPQARVIATDVNPKALRFARINAAGAGATIETLEASGLQGVAAPVDMAMLNPPYIIDEEGRTYRHGGGMHGGEVSLDLTVEAMDLLAPRGRVLLYTGSAIIDGEDPLCQALERETRRRGFALHYREIDPDVFGEELEKPHYKDVERIALIGATVIAG